MDKRNEYSSDTFGKYNNENEVKNVNSKDWNLISEGDPAQRVRQPEGTRPPSPSPDGERAEKKRGKKQSKKKEAPSRTPKGRDLRRDAREQQKDREEQFRVREDYNEQIKNQQSHDEVSRKINKKKRKKYVLRNWVKVALALIFAFLCFAGYAVFRGALIETVDIKGNSIYTEEEIYQASGVKPGKCILLISEKRAYKRLTKRLPYIKEVTLERHYPRSVTMNLVTTTDRFVISSSSGSFSLDKDRKIVSESKVEAKKGVYFAEGFDFQSIESGDIYEPEGANIERYALFVKIAELLEKSKAITTAVVEIEDIKNVRVIVDGNIAIYFGSCKELEDKVPYVSAIVTTVRKAGKSGYIDMTTRVGFFMPGTMEKN